MVLLTAVLAFAEPTRCVSTWQPSSGCAIRGEVKATAAAGSENAARKASLRQLREVAKLSVAATRARLPTLPEADFAACDARVIEEAHTSCFADDTLADPEALCFVELKDPECWAGTVLQLDEGGVGAIAAGREMMCAAVDARLVAQNYTDVATRRVVCKASCAAQTSVSCPTGR